MNGDNHAVRAAEAWDTFCEQLKQAGNVLLRDNTPNDELTQAEGLRYLARQLHIGFENAFELADMDRPRLHPMVGSHKLYEGVTGDCRYHHAYFDGTRTHRIEGRRGDSPLIEIGVYTGKGGYDEGSVQTAGITEKELVVNADGSFELILSPDQHDGNWIETNADTRYIMIREYAADWTGLQPGQFEMHWLGAPDAIAPLSLDRVEAGLEGTVKWMAGAPPRWTAITDFWVDLAPNQFACELPQTEVIDIGAPKGHQFGVCSMTLEPGQAMIARFKTDGEPYWSLSLVNYWWEPLAFREDVAPRQTTTAITNATVDYEDDGSVRAVIANCPSRGANWLDTRGHNKCMVLFRISRSAHPVPPIDVEFVSLDSLDA